MVEKQATQKSKDMLRNGRSQNHPRAVQASRQEVGASTAFAVEQLEFLSFTQEIPPLGKKSSRKNSNESSHRNSMKNSNESSYKNSMKNSNESSYRNSVKNSNISSKKKSVRRNRKSSGKIVITAACFIVALAAIAGYVYYELPHRCVRDSVTIEAGDACPSVAEFLEWECEGAYFVSGIDEGMEFNHVQDYEVTIHLYHQDIATTLHVADTVPPKVQTKDKTIMFGEIFEIEDFVEGILDVTACEISYREEPMIPGGGIYAVILEVQDEGGNITEADARLEVLQDVTPPVIEGVEEITITAGESVSYKRNIVVTDDYDDAVKLEVDNSEVDTDTPGDYRVVYRATDKYGNMTEVETVIHVKRVVPASELPPSAPVTEEAVNAEADIILASITNSSMSQYEVLRAIYDWCHSKIAYVDGTEKSDWVNGAYAGLVLRRGDCYTYAMTAKCLLTRAGITNMDIQRVPYANKHHFWNLVDIGEGWHHFDTCRRVDGSTFFYLTDAELMAYSEAHTSRSYPNGTHYYDRTLYPEIP